MKRYKLECPMCGRRFRARLAGWDNPFGKHRERCPNKRCKRPLVSIDHAVPPWSGWKRMGDLLRRILSMFKRKPKPETKPEPKPEPEPEPDPKPELSYLHRLKQDPIQFRSKMTDRLSHHKTVLRPLRQNLHDEAIYDEPPESCNYWKRRLFCDRRRFHNGQAKTEINCNLPSDGMLGTPLEYDLVFLDVTFISPELTGRDVVYLAQNMNFQWRFGCTIWLNTVVSEGKKLLIANLPQDQKKHYIDPAWIDTEIASGLVFRFDMTNHMKQARHILSNEHFEAEVQLDAGKLEKAYPRFRVRVSMVGILYACL